MTWACIKCGQHNDNDFPPNIDWSNPRVMKYVKRVREIEDSGKDPFAKCSYCSYNRSIKVK